MKKFFTAAILTASILLNTCFAMTRADFSLGGLTLDNNYSEVIRMYGEPTSKPGGWAQLVSDVIKYGDDVEIGFLGKKIRYIVTTANNGWKTPAGVYVGMPISKVIEIYGADYKTVTREKPINPNEKYFYYKWSGTKYSWSEPVDEDTKYILSVIVNEGTVTAIELNQQTPEN